MNKKNITIIATGGTIAGRGSLGKSANYEAGTLMWKKLLKVFHKFVIWQI